MSFALGLDVSTTATKAVLVASNGQVAAVASHPHDIISHQPLWSEQNPEEWWTATQNAVRSVIDQANIRPEEIAGLALAGQMHGLVLLDADGDVLRPAILWNDQRATQECEDIRSIIGKDRLVEITGNDAFAGFSAPKLLWIRKHEPEVYSRVRSVLLPKDYVRYRMTGELATDRAGAGGTLFLDLRTRDWSAEVLDGLGIPRDWLPPTHEGTEQTGEISNSAARRTGLARGTPVYGGGGDQAAQATGVGVIKPGTMAVTLGTSGVVFAPADRPIMDPKGRIHAFPHALPDMWHVMGVMLSAAGSMQWYRDTLAPAVPFEALVREAEGVPCGSDGLIFLPYLSGERTPHADANARGAFVGLTLSHGRGHLTRAVMEGVAFGLRDNLDLLEASGIIRPDQIRISGGGARSPLWSQILADILGVELVTAEVVEAAAVGCALLAGVGSGIWPDVETACDRACIFGTSTSPVAAAADLYKEIHETFRALYPALKTCQ